MRTLRVNSLLSEGYATQQKADENFEEWKAIPGYEGLYEASSLGRIRTANGKTTSNARFEKRVWKTRIMRTKAPKKGRHDKRVSLWKDGEQKDWLVARLVAMAWLGPPEEKLTVNHINGDYCDNRPENLEWVSLSENIKKGFDGGQYDSIQNGVLLIGEDGEERRFRSMERASAFLEKNHGYVSKMRKTGRTYVVSRSGKRYRLVA